MSQTLTLLGATDAHGALKRDDLFEALQSESDIAIHFFTGGGYEQTNIGNVVHHPIDAPSFLVPGYSLRFNNQDQPVPIPYLLLHQRIDLVRDMRALVDQLQDESSNPIVLQAHTPGVFGLSLLQVSLSEGLPLIAFHAVDYAQYIEEQLYLILDSKLRNISLLSDTFSSESFLYDIFPDIERQRPLMNSVNEIIDHLQTILRVLPKPLSLWDRVVLGIARFIAPGAGRVIGASSALGEILKECEKIGIRSLGDETFELLRLGETEKVVSIILSRGAKSIANQYLKWFYNQCSCVIALSQEGRCQLEVIGVSPLKIRNVEHQSLPGQYKEVHEKYFEEKPERQILEELDTYEFASPDPKFESFVSVSDVHMGDGDLENQSHALRALFESMQKKGIKNLIWNGDIGELSARPDRFEQAKKSINTVRKNFQNFDEIVVRGNHDEGLNFSEILPGVTESESLVYYEKSVGVVFTHNHILGMREFFDALSNCETAEEIVVRLKPQGLASSLKFASMIHDLATVVWRRFEDTFNVRKLWKETGQPSISRTIRWLRGLRTRDIAESQKDRLGSGWARLLESVCSPADDERAAAELAAAIDSPETPCFLQCGGHWHMEDLKSITVTHPRTGKMVTKIVANSGKLHGDTMSCIVGHYPEVITARWNKEKGKWFVRKEMSA